MKKILSLLMLALVSIGTAWAADYPDANYLLLNGANKNKIEASQIGGTGVTWSCNESKYSYGSTTCTFYGNAFTKGLKHEGATWTQIVLTETATLTIVQSLATNPTGTLLFENTANAETKAEIATWDNYLEKSYEGENTVGGNTYKDVKVMKLFNLPAGTYRVYRGNGGGNAQTYVVYMGVTYETTPSYTISTEVSNGGASTVSGAGSYLRGFPVTLEATPSAGKAFDHWELSGSNVSTDNPYTFDASTTATYTAVFVNAATKSITVAPNNEEYGTADATATTVAKGSTTTLTAAVAGEAYYFKNWTKSSDGTWSDANTTIEVAFADLTDGETFTANFDKKFMFTYSKGDYETGTQKKYFYGTITKYAHGSTGSITLPVNYGIVYSSDLAEAANHTMKYWTNGGPNYAAGGGYTLNNDLENMVPGFSTNTVSIRTLAEATTVTWPFAANSGAPSDLHVEGATGYYVVQATIDGEKIDVPMFLDNTSGKFVVAETRAQVNSGSKFAVPAVKGMVVKYTADSGAPAADQFATDDADNVEIAVDGKVVTFTYSGTNTTLTITDNNGGYWPVSLSVTYPAASAATVATITVPETISDGEYYYTTFSSDKALDFSDVEGIEAYTGVKTGNGAYLTLTQVEQIPANTGVVIKAAKAKDYTIPFAEGDVEAPEANDLIAAVETVSSSTVINGYLIDGYGESRLGNTLYFRSIGSVATDIPAGSAYLSLTNDEEDKAYGFVYCKFPAGPAVEVADIAALKEQTSETATLKLTDAKVTYVGDYYMVIEDATGGVNLSIADLDEFSKMFLPYYKGNTFDGELGLTYDVENMVYAVSDMSGMIADEEAPVAEPLTLTEENIYDYMMNYDWKWVSFSGAQYTTETKKLTIAEFGGVDYQVQDVLYAGVAMPEEDAKVNVEGYLYLLDLSFYGMESQILFQPTKVEVVPAEPATLAVTVGADGYATFCSDKALDFTGAKSIKAYTATLSGTDITFKRIYNVPANTGVLLWAESGASEEIPVVDGGGVTGIQNVLKGTMEAIPAGSLTGKYILAKNGENIGFYKAGATATLAAGKAYIEAPAAARIILPGGETTGINGVEAAEADAAVYNLQGQRIQKAQKGLNIKNGRKYIVR